MKQRDYWDYVYDIKDAINAVQNFVEGMDKTSFTHDLKTIYAVRKALEIIGEAAKNIPQSFKDKYPDIPWRQMSGMRDKLVHKYFGVKIDVLWETVQKDIPSLKSLFIDMIKKKMNYELIRNNCLRLPSNSTSCDGPPCLQLTVGAINPCNGLSP
ncbi:DUF86 domain-containing protein [Thermovenabulum sp.]|uniref:HepT-like ribonuclease domain-containing protein n=1 Tax=Thermovenabulum sp. TaxID=3100335 RepID=UPI003C7D18C7